MKNIEPAKCNYKRIRFSHILIKPDDNNTLTVDPWSYLYGYLLKEKNTYLRKCDQTIRLERAIFYLELAKEFFLAGKETNLPTKATLQYYSMLNLVKCFLSTRGIELETIHEHHGATIPLKQNKVLKIQKKNGKNDINIFAEFSYLLNGKYHFNETIGISEVLYNIPELHAVFCNAYPKRKDKLLPIDILFFTNEKHNVLTTGIAHEEKYKTSASSEVFLKQERKEYFKEKPEDIGTHRVYLSKKIRRNIDLKKCDTIYHNILKEYYELGTKYILTRNGYRNYFDLKPTNKHQLLYSLLGLFYFGTIARYKPTLMNEMMQGEMRAVITEACEICPQQFVYNLVSLITNRVCLLPHSSLT